MMHLLAETAIGDSVNFEVLPFEEVEELKRELSLLSNRIESLRRKLALETKLQEAAQSLSRLYDNPGGHEADGTNDRSGEELATSARKCDELAQELWKLEQRASEIRTRLLEHTAGILQVTHKGLKKKSSKKHPGGSEGLTRGHDTGLEEEFDDRSLYRTPDYLDDLNGDHGNRDPPGGHTPADLSGLQDARIKLEELNHKLRDMILQVNPDQDIDSVPQHVANGTTPNPIIAVNAHLEYLQKGLESISSQKVQPSHATEDSLNQTEEKLEEFGHRLDRILATTGSTPQSSRNSTVRRPLHEQLEYLDNSIDEVQRRIDTLMDQKTILTTQIQQQRELNSKSDAQRDAHISDLSTEIADLKRKLESSGTESGNTREEIDMLMHQLDAARQESMLREQKLAEEEGRAANTERELRDYNEQELAARDRHIEGLEASLQQLRSDKGNEINESLEAKERHIKDLEISLQQLQAQRDIEVKEAAEAKEKHIGDLEASLLQLRTEKDDEVKDAYEAKEKADTEASRLQSEYAELESEMIRIQTELTIAKAELDSAYGSRAERAAEAAANPTIQREIDDLNQKNKQYTEEIAALKIAQLSKSNSEYSELQQRIQTLEKELRDTIDDYEVMTKASIEFEKERDKFENIIDSYRDQCDGLEAQLNDERIQALGSNRDGFPPDTTSTTVLKTEFKKMMRDAKAENKRILKVCDRDIIVFPTLSWFGSSLTCSYRPNKRNVDVSKLSSIVSKRNSPLPNRILAKVPLHHLNLFIYTFFTLSPWLSLPLRQQHTSQIYYFGLSFLPCMM